MGWHLITTIGVDDLYSPEIGLREPRIIIPFEHPTNPWKFGNDTERVLLEGLQFDVEPVVRDLVRLGVSVFSADLRVPRVRTDDRWERDFCLHLPVSDVQLWQSAKPLLSELLNFLSGDHWDLEFRDSMPVERTDGLERVPFDVASLFSGGLDSLVGALDLLSMGHRVALVSHHGLGDGAKAIQLRILDKLEALFPGQILHLPFFVHPAKGNTNERENTMRSRSLLFVAMGVAAASAAANATLVIPENGLISLNVPLTGARTGSLSTRTTHPHYIALFRRLLTELGIDVTLALPYRHITKGEMLLRTANPDALALTASLSMSCSHPTVGRYAGKSPGNHCGYCVPCIIRFASLKAAGIPYTNPDWDVNLNPSPSTSRRSSDLRAFKMGIERLAGSDPRKDLFRVLRSGPLPAEEAREFADVYRRGMREVAAFLNVPLN